MFYASEIHTEAPCQFQTFLQELVYGTLAKLQIPFQPIDTDEAIAMEDCVAIEDKRGMKMVKALFLCNRQKTDFYLFLLVGNKAFHSKNFSHALSIARVSFAPVNQMEAMLGTKIGAATVLSSLLDHENRVRIVFDLDVVSEKWYGCSDGTTTRYTKMGTAAIYRMCLPLTKHTPSAIEV